ncbi:FYVE-type domain-containing protein [Entamoeba marina]
MSTVGYFPDVHSDYTPSPLRDLTNHFKQVRSKYTVKYSAIAKRIDYLISSSHKEERKPNNEKVLLGNCNICNKQVMVMKTCNCCKKKICKNCCTNAHFQFDQQNSLDPLKVKFYFCLRCFKVFNGMREAKRFLRVTAVQHPIVKMRDTLIEAAKEIISKHDILGHVESKDEVLRICNEGQQSIKNLHSIIDGYKKSGLQYELLSDRVVATNLLMALNNFSKTFAFCFIEEISKTEKMARKPLPLPVIKEMNCKVIPISGGELKIKGIGLARINATVDGNNVKVTLIDKELCIEIPQTNPQAIGEQVKLELKTGDGVLVKLPDAIVYCDY